MAWRIQGRLCVVVHGSRGPTNLEWQSFLKDMFAQDGGANRTLVVSYGGAPDGEQRKALTRATGTADWPIAVLTGSALVRAVAGVLGFLNRRMKAFDLANLDGAFSFLGLTPDERDTARRTCRELEQGLGMRAVS